MSEVNDVTDDRLAEIGVSRDEWDGLQPIEREALLIEEDESAHEEITDDAIAAAKQVVEEGETQKQEAAAAETPTEDEKRVEKQAEPREEREFVPMPAVPTQEEIDGKAAEFSKRQEQIAAAEKTIEDKLNDLESKLEEGDLTSIEFMRERRRLDKQILEITKASAVLEADRKIAQEALSQSNRNASSVMQQRYLYAQEAFYADDKNEALYSHASLGERARTLLLNQFVPALAQLPENANRSFNWLLREGDRRVRAFMIDDIAQAGVSSEPASQPVAARKAAPGRAPDLSKIPKTLGNLPVAAQNSVDTEFGHLDKLEGAAYLAALEKLSPAQREKYEAMQ